MEVSGQLHALPTFHPNKKKHCAHFIRGAWWAPNFGPENNPHFSFVRSDWCLNIKITRNKMRDFRLLPQSRRELRFSGMLRSN
jgi:hypothetical protein